MRPGNFRIVLFLFSLTFLTAVIFISCDKEPPTSPAPPVPQQTAYTAYFTDINTPTFYYAYQVENDILDTLVLEHRSEQGLELSNDGNTLYLFFQDSVVAVDLNDPTKTTKLPDNIKGPVVFSPDNSLLAYDNNGIKVVDDSYTEIFSDTLTMKNPIFTDDNKYLYFTNNGDVCCLDFTQNNQFTRTDLGDYAIKVVPLKNQNKWLLNMYDLTNDVNSFRVYDVATETFLLTDNIGYHSGDIVFTPNEDKAFFSYADTRIISPDGFGEQTINSSFRVYDLQNNQLENEIYTDDVAELIAGRPIDVNYYPEINRLKITPDGSWIVMLEASGGAIMRFNVNQMQVDSYKFIFTSKLYGLTINASK